jgi:hypothetical protein
MRLLLVFMCSCVAYAQQYYSPLAVDVTRSLVKDLFNSNAVAYVDPMVTTINAVSNARFYDRAYVPDTNGPIYVKVSINGMLGTVREDQRSYVPSLSLGMPSESLIDGVAQYGTIDIPNGRYVINPTYEDTLGLTNYLLRETLLEAQKQGRLPTPSRAATLFGNMPDVRFFIPPTDTLIDALRQRSDYRAIAALAPNIDSSLARLLDSLSLPNYLTMPPGANLNSLIAMVPQFEIGSLYGTELLIRFIPPVELDKNIGKFSFYGLGVKHSLSQYFPDRWIDVAVQAVYQTTSLTNVVGVTNSTLEANADIWSGNIQIGKHVWGIIDVYTALAYENIQMTSVYSYVLPQELQQSLGLLPLSENGQAAVPTAEQPGDNRPQRSEVQSQNTNVKVTIGASAVVGPVRLAVDYNISQFNIFTAGLSFAF